MVTQLSSGDVWTLHRRWESPEHLEPSFSVANGSHSPRLYSQSVAGNNDMVPPHDKGDRKSENDGSGWSMSEQ